MGKKYIKKLLFVKRNITIEIAKLFTDYVSVHPSSCYGSDNVLQKILKSLEIFCISYEFQTLDKDENTTVFIATMCIKETALSL